MITHRRLHVLMVCLIAAYSVLALRLFHLNVVRGAEYRDRAERRRVGHEPLPALRGAILDRHGRLLAVDEPGFSLNARISEVEGAGATQRLARRLHVPRAQLIEALASLDARLAALATSLDAAAATAVRARLYRLPEIAISPGEDDLLELATAPEDYWGFTVRPEPDGNYGLYVCPAEHSGDAAIERIARLAAGDLTTDDLRARIAFKQAWIEKEAAERLGSRAGNEARLRKVISDLRGWSLPLFEDVGDALAREATLHPQSFAGFELHAKPQRRYPAGESVVHIVGHTGVFGHLPLDKQKQRRARKSYLDDDLYGTSGIEAAFEARLHGTAGYQVVERNRTGGGKNTLHLVSAQDGDPVPLTLDVDLQRAANAALDRAGRPGAVVVLDPRNGEILALATSPRYDPTDYVKKHEQVRDAVPSRLVNRAVRGHNQMPPGSVFKLVTALAGLSAGTLDPEHTIYECRSGSSPKCENHLASRGPIGLGRALAASCNVFFAGAAVESGRALDEWTWKLGFGQSTGIEIGESTYRRCVEGLRQAHESTRRRMGIGQQIEASPLQIARMTAVFANGGLLVTPHLELGRSGLVRRDLHLAAAHVEVVQRGMEAAVDAGTATGDGLERFGTAGKTGSAEAGTDLDSGSTLTHAWFTGYAPREAPEVVVTVFLDHAGHGGDVATPVASDVLESYFRLRQERGQ